MESHNSAENNFVKQLTDIVESNLSNPKFGVSMLAKEMGMSRSNLHRKVNNELKITVSQFINHIRLKKAKDILRHTSNTVSEVAYEVGFSNVSYFIKCFHEYYGYSPGEIGNREEYDNKLKQSVYSNRKVLIPIISIVIIAVVLILVFQPFLFQRKKLRYTFAVLPPEIYENVDTIQIFGIMQSVRNNLGKINDIEVKPWLSVQQFKNTTEPPPKIAQKLDVNYLVQSRVWLNNEEVILIVNLIEGPRDKDLGTYVHPIDSNNISKIHLDIIKDITKELDIPISPAEQRRIDKVITSNKKALEYYWEGMKYLEGPNSIKADRELAISCFNKALQYDEECASAWAKLCHVYFLLYNDNSNFKLNYDSAQFEMYKNNIIEYANMANLYDPDLDKTLFALALSARVMGHYATAVRYLEKALEYNPNLADAYREISLINYRYERNPPKIIEYALKAVYYEKLKKYSPKIEEFHRWAARSLRVAGLYDEALVQIEESIKANSNYLIAYQEKSEILISIHQNVDSAKLILLNLIKEHPEFRSAKTFLFKDLFWNREFEKAYDTFKELYTIDNVRNFNSYNASRLLERFVVTLEHLGYKNEYDLYKKILDKKPPPIMFESGVPTFFSLMRKHCINHNPDRAMEEFRNYNKSEYFLAYHIYMLEFSPVFDILRENKEYHEILAEAKTKFEAKRDQIREMLKEKELL